MTLGNRKHILSLPDFPRKDQNYLEKALITLFSHLAILSLFIETVKAHDISEQEFHKIIHSRRP